MLKIVETLSSDEWDWKHLSANPSITPEFVRKCFDKPWDWCLLSRNSSVTPEFVDEHIEKPWKWGWLSANPNLTVDFIQRHHDKPWDWSRISRNPFTRELRRQCRRKLVRILRNRDPFYHNPWMLRLILENFF